MFNSTKQVELIAIADFMSNNDQELRVASSAITSYVGGTMFVLGTVGNLINIVVFCCLKPYRSLVTTTFLAAASLAGQLYLTNALGIGAMSKWIGYDIPSRNSAICKFITFIRKFSIQVSLTCLCLSSIDRYLMTSRTVQLRQFFTLTRARLMMCASIVVWACAAIPHAIFTLDFAPSNLCIPSSNFASTVTYLNLILAVLLPITILSTFGLLTWKNLGNTRLTALNSQVTRMILLDIAVVSLSNIPLGMFLLYAGTRNSSARFTAIEALLIVTTQLISTVQVFGSFYFYMLVSSTFRNNVKKLLYRIFCCGKTNGEHRVGPLTVTVGVRRTVLVAPKSMKISSVVI